MYEFFDSQFKRFIQNSSSPKDDAQHSTLFCQTRQLHQAFHFAFRIINFTFGQPFVNPEDPAPL